MKTALTAVAAVLAGLLVVLAAMLGIGLVGKGLQLAGGTTTPTPSAPTGPTPLPGGPVSPERPAGLGPLTPIPEDGAERRVGREVATIPVLVYHGVARPGAEATADEVTLGHLTAQLDLLRRRGYSSIGPEEYAAWLQRRPVALPPHPVLITFDDNLASVAVARPALRDHRYRPVMYAASGFAEGGFGGQYLGWAALRQLAAEGWHLQLHAGPCGHAYLKAQTPYRCAEGLRLGANPKIGHRFYPQLSGQDVATHRQRVAADLDAGTAALARHLDLPPGWRSTTFAVPWDDWGQPGTSGQPWLAQLLSRRYPVVFVQESYPGARVAGPAHLRYRFQVGPTTTTAQLAAALRRSEFRRG